MQAQFGVGGRRLAEYGRYGYLWRLNIRLKMDAAQEDLRPRFQVNGLPDAARVAVPLLPLEFEAARRIIYAQHQPLLMGGLEEGCQIKLKWGVSTAMKAKRLAIQPSLGLPIARAEHQEHPLARPGFRHTH